MAGDGHLSRFLEEVEEVTCGQAGGERAKIDGMAS